MKIIRKEPKYVKNGIRAILETRVIDFFSENKQGLIAIGARAKTHMD